MGTKTMEQVVLVEVYTEAKARFGHRADGQVIVAGAVDAARELLAKRPQVTDFVVDIAIATSLTRLAGCGLAA